MTCSGQLLTRIEASEALTRLQKAAETGDWAELKPEEAQEAAALLVDSAARIRDLEAQLAAQAEALAAEREATLYAVVSETTQGYRFDGLHTQPEGAQQHQREVITAEVGKLIMTDVYALVRVQTQENTLGAQS